MTPSKPISHRLYNSVPRNGYCSQLQLPLTPESTPSKSTKRSAEHAFEEPSYSLSLTKQRRTDPDTQSLRQLTFRRGPVPRFSILYKAPPPLPLHFSGDELRRICEAMLLQIDWDEAQEYVASNRTAATYRKALKSILQAEVDKLYTAENDEEASY